MAATLTVVIGESGCMGTCSICDALGWAVSWLGEGGDVLCRAGELRKIGGTGAARAQEEDSGVPREGYTCSRTLLHSCTVL